ncbi:CheR family methyltransferase [Alkaliphilus sp. B6464]|uniref:CheR family methyltransferase n=1 Tax=Alkaliphilus sp. B6464 TaxID=2731219 RepID=UPI001BAABFCE|nr:protein-glutamate O-methyltransferase CheR [Alkaliphilus sp. B6464]QUH20751.1 protein-glutamate O-methyltransferase CheR [Alkaliphilus sp. B6464]
MEGYEIFKDKVYKKTGINLNSYKERQMKRRIESLITRNNFTSYDSYFNAINKDLKLLDEFINYLTINVSEFYRNPQQWEVLESTVIPYLLKNKSKLKIWSSACSTGEEPYSLVMLLSKFFPLSQISVLATDIDEGAISKANKGIYSPKSLENLPKEFINSFFEKHNEEYKIKEEIKKQVTFKQFNLLEDEYPKQCDLILCRNVMIYFTEEAKNDMYKNFHDSLSNEGVLFVGSTEQIILPNRYNLTPLKTFFYKKTKPII